jgi:hypothetical protein
MQVANKDESEGRVATDASLILFSNFVNTKFSIFLVGVKWPCHSVSIRVANRSIES